MTLYFCIPINYAYDLPKNKTGSYIQTVENLAKSVNNQFQIDCSYFQKHIIRGKSKNIWYDLYKFHGSEDEFLIFILKSGFITLDEPIIL